MKEPALRRLTDEEKAKVDANRGLAHTIARMMVNGKKTKLELDDAVQAGLTGLMRASQMFRPELGYAFSTYAVYHIKAAIQRAGYGVGLVHVPAYVREMLRSEKARPTRLRKYADAGARALRVDPICDEVPPVDRRTGECGARMEREELVEVLVAAVGDLSDREFDIVAARWLDEECETLDSLGRRHGLTRERVRQIEVHALRKLREHTALAAYAEGA